MPSLSEAQKKVIRALRAGGRLSYVEYLQQYRLGRKAINERTVTLLSERGYIQLDGNPRFMEWILTDKGRAVNTKPK